jgi:hypothetical protein
VASKLPGKGSIAPRPRGAIRPDIHTRFLLVVARGLARAEREEVAHLAAIRASRGDDDDDDERADPRRSPTAERVKR